MNPGCCTPSLCHAGATHFLCKYFKIKNNNQWPAYNHHSDGRVQWGAIYYAPQGGVNNKSHPISFTDKVRLTDLK